MFSFPRTGKRNINITRPGREAPGERGKMKIKIHADNGEESADIIYEAKEQGNDSGYGCGQYISLKPIGGSVILVDCRYMKGYNLEKAARNYLENYYGENLKSIEII